MLAAILQYMRPSINMPVVVNEPLTNARNKASTTAYSGQDFTAYFIFAQLSLRVEVRLKTRCSGVESLSVQK